MKLLSHTRNLITRNKWLPPCWNVNFTHGICYIFLYRKPSVKKAIFNIIAKFKCDNARGVNGVWNQVGIAFFAFNNRGCELIKDLIKIENERRSLARIGNAYEKFENSLIDIKAAIERDPASGNGIDVFTITKDGVKQVVSEEAIPQYK